MSRVVINRRNAKTSGRWATEVITREVAPEAHRWASNAHWT